MFRKSAKLIIAFILSLAAAPGVFALNYSGWYDENKPISFSGYQFVDGGGTANDTLRIYFDKDTISPGEVDEVMFTVRPHGGGPAVAIYSYTRNRGYGYSGCTDTYLTFGTEVILGLANLQANRLYDVTISGSLMDTNGITLGNYMNRKDLTFTFRTPQADGSYPDTGDSMEAPSVTYVVGDPDNLAGVSYESNMIVIFDRPFAGDAASLTKFKLSLQTNFINTTDNEQVAGKECYAVTSNNRNNVNTTFYFPQTKFGLGTAYNRASDGSHSYRLTLPAFTDVSGNVWSHFNGGGDSFHFSTVSADLPGWAANGMPNVPLAVIPGHASLQVSWKATTITPAPEGYYVYYIDSAHGKWASATQWTLAGATVETSYTITELDTAKSYYVRVVPYNSAGSVGFSIANAAPVAPLLGNGGNN